MAEKKQSFSLADAIRGTVVDAGIAAVNVSKSDTGREQIEYIPRTSLVSDEKNFYSLDGIDALAANIELIGLQQPLRVRPVDGGDGLYRVVSGHRRRAALDKLALDGSKDFEQVPCIVERDNVSPALQELRLIYANADTRRMSSADTAKQVERVTELLYQLKEEGFEFPGRMRDHVAEACKINKTRIATLKVIRGKLIEPWTRMWESGTICESAAYVLAKLPRTQQEAMYEHLGGKARWMLTENRFERYSEKLREVKGLNCRFVAGGGDCNRQHERMAAILTADPWRVNYCAKCCYECPELIWCKFACPKASQKMIQLKAEAKEQRAKKKLEKAAILAPRIELIEKLWRRCGEARAAAGMSMKEFGRLCQPYFYDSEADAYKKLERGETKITENTETPFGSTVGVEDVQQLSTLADKLGVSLDYLFCRTDDPTPPGAVSKSDTAAPAWQTDAPQIPPPEEQKQ